MNIHGEFKFFWDGDLLTINKKGPFNDEGVLACSEQIKAVIRDENLPSWRRLEILDDDTLASIPAFEHISKLYVWYNEHGFLATAIVVSNNVQTDAIKRYIKSNAAIFYKLSDATDWINHQ